MPHSTTTPQRTPAIPSSGIVLRPEIPVCQTDLPLDWYQSEFRPYAEEYLALREKAWRIRSDALHTSSLPALREADKMERASMEPPAALVTSSESGFFRIAEFIEWPSERPKSSRAPPV